MQLVFDAQMIAVAKVMNDKKKKQLIKVSSRDWSQKPSTVSRAFAFEALNPRMCVIISSHSEEFEIILTQSREDNSCYHGCCMHGGGWINTLRRARDMFRPNAITISLVRSETTVLCTNVVRFYSIICTRRPLSCWRVDTCAWTLCAHQNKRQNNNIHILTLLQHLSASRWCARTWWGSLSHSW